MPGLAELKKVLKGTSKRVGKSQLNPFNTFKKIRNRARKQAVKRRVKDFEGVPDSELVRKADRRLSIGKRK